MASRLTRWLAVLLAVVLPIAVVAGGLAGLESFRTFADKRETRNVCKVINGKVVREQGGAPKAIERTLERTSPEIIILGNSLSNTDLVPQLLANSLGMGKQKVQKFSIPNSIAAHWYVILKNRVYANGHRPKIVVILSDLQSALALAPRSEASHLNLTCQLGRSERVVDDKLGARNYYLERVRENRGTVREGAMTAARNALVDLLYHHTLVPTDDREIEKSLERVFDDEKTDMWLHNQVIPIMQGDTLALGQLLAFDPAELPDPKDSFLPEIVKLVTKNEGHVVFVRPPMSPQLAAQGLGDIVDVRKEQKVHKVVDRLGGTYLDLRTVPMDNSHFKNRDHMNPEGARRFTQMVAELLDDLRNQGGNRPAEADLLKSIGLVGGRFENLVPDIVYRGAPPEVPRPKREFYRGRGRLAYFATESFGFLSDPSTVDVTPHASRCSPLRVVEDGVALPEPNVGCDEVLRFGAGRACHAPERLYFATPDGTDPFENGREYMLALDPERLCDASRWLYPGDHLRLTVDPFALDAFTTGAATLSVEATDMGSTGRGGEPVLQVRVRAGAGTRADVPVPLGTLGEGPVSVPLEPRIGAIVDTVTVDLVNPSDHFVLVTGLRLLEPRRGKAAPEGGTTGE